MSNALEKYWKRFAAPKKATQTAKPEKGSGLPVLPDEQTALLSSLPGLVSVHAYNGELVWANDAFFSEFMSSKDSRLGFLDQVNPQDRLNVLAAFDRVSTSEISVELKRQALDHASRVEVRNYQMNCAVHSAGPTYSGRPLILVSTRNTDISSALESRYENQISALQDKLEQRQCFFNTINHELRTPLNAITGFSQMLEGQMGIELSETKKLEYASAISTAAQHSLELINDLLDLAKLESGNQEMAEEDVDLGDVLSEVLLLLSPIAAKCGVNINSIQCDDMPVVRSDRRAIKQILINLVANALNYSDKGDRVELSVHRRRKDVSICVSDTGRGMDSETLGKLGTAFFQASSKKCCKSGTGLGLSIVHALVDALGCELSVNSTLGEGSQFYVSIPLAKNKPKPVRSNPETEIVYLRKQDSAPVNGEFYQAEDDIRRNK